MNNENYLNRENIQTQFEKDILNDHINSNLITLFETEISEVFPNILIIPKNEFINIIESRIKDSLSEQYPNENIEQIFKNNKFSNIFNKNMKILLEKYSIFIKDLNDTWEKYKNITSSKKIKEEKLYFSDFRKHCIKTGKYAVHKCSNNNYGEYLSVLHKSSVDGSLSVRYLICKKCKKSYFISLFLNYCKECDISYYSSKLYENEKTEFQLITFNPPHCKSLFNKKINCPKCIHDYLYLNLKTNELHCLNKKCNFICNSDNSSWKCDICHSNFKTNIKIYNPLEIQNVKDAIKLALIIKKKAHPIRMICCNKINVYNCVFYHSKNCDGILYLGELDKNAIIICQKCKAINYFDNFIWTCPSCGKRFKENPDNYQIFKRNKKDLIKEEKSARLDAYKISKYFNSVDDKKEYRINKKYFGEGRNEDKKNLNKIYEQKTSNINDKKKKYILSKYLEMQISLNSNNCNKESNNVKIKESKKINKNDKLVNYKDNNFIINDEKEINNKKLFRNGIRKNYILRSSMKTNEKSSNTIEERLKIKNIEINKLNNSKEKKEILDYFNNTDYKKNISENKPFSINKISKKNINELDKSKENNNKSTDIDENLNKGNDNNAVNPVKPRFGLKKYISNELNVDNSQHNNFIFYKSQNIFNIRSKYKNNNMNNNKINDINIINNNKKSNNIKEIKEYGINSPHKNDITENNEKIVNNKKKKMYHRRLFNILNSSKKEEEDESKKLDIKKLNLDNSNKMSSGDINGIIIKKKLYKKYSSDILENNNTKNLLNNENKEINEIKIKDNNKKEEKEKKELLEEMLLNLEKEREIKNKPDDIIEIENIINDNNFNIPVISKSLSENERLYKDIQNKIKLILSKGKLPLFDIRNYIIKKQIGDGSYGFIYKAIQKYTRKEYAIKKIIASDIETLKEFQIEFEIVHQNQHPYILDLYGICITVIDIDNFILYILMDLADCDWEMEINEYLLNHIYYTEKQLISILKQLISALTFLEKEKKIAHRDIKPENVLVFRDNSGNIGDIYKIADFGEAKEAKISKQLNTLRGTELYMSPLLYKCLKENVDDVKHNPYKSDVFSLGYCLIYAAAMNFNIIYDIRNLENKYTIKRVLKKYFNNRYSDKFIELILKMITFDESQRVDFIELNDILKKEF